MNSDTTPNAGSTTRHGPIAGPRCKALCADERFAIGLIRHIVIHGAGLPIPASPDGLRLVPGSPATFAALGEWLTLLANAATRQIAVGAPTHCCPSPDEVRMLAIMAGAPRGDFSFVHMLLGEMVKPDAVDALAHGAEQLGERLIDSGIVLRPVRFTGPAAS